MSSRRRRRLDDDDDDSARSDGGCCRCSCCANASSSLRRCLLRISERSFGVIATRDSPIGSIDPLSGSLGIRLLPLSVDADADTAAVATRSAFGVAVVLVVLVVDSARETSNEERHKRTTIVIAVESAFERHPASLRKPSKDRPIFRRRMKAGFIVPFIPVLSRHVTCQVPIRISCRRFDS